MHLLSFHCYLHQIGKSETAFSHLFYSLSLISLSLYLPVALFLSFFSLPISIWNSFFSFLFSAFSFLLSISVGALFSSFLLLGNKVKWLLKLSNCLQGLFTFLGVWSDTHVIHDLRHQYLLLDTYFLEHHVPFALNFSTVLHINICWTKYLFFLQAAD